MNSSVELTENDISLVLRDKVAPLLHAHGGDVVLSRIVDKTVYVRFLGSCRFCPSASETIEKIVRAAICDSFGDPSIQVFLESGVSEELINEAKKILNKSKA
ncbi:MAG: NifU family protein [Porphyromonas sp.]|nr:NifU family protein [Porphyromonas sp.]